MYKITTAERMLQNLVLEYERLADPRLVCPPPTIYICILLTFVISVTARLLSQNRATYRDLLQ